MTTLERLRGSDSQQHKGLVEGGSEKPEIGEYGALVNGQWLKTGNTIEVRSPFNNALAGIVHRAGPVELEAALAAAVEAFEITRKMPAWQRAQILEKISAGITQRREELAHTIALEAGKPLKTARGEVDRAVLNFKTAAEETKRIYGQIVPLDWVPGTEGRVGHVHRVPLGPILGITPFNFPINLVAHKVAPALAAGNPIIIRPASQTPLASFKLGEIILAAGWSAGGFAVVPCSTKDAQLLVEDRRIKLLTFTGSPAVGWDIKNRAGRKRVTLELGGNAGVIVHSDADVAYAAERVTWGGFAYSGQTCVSVQRIYVHEDVYAEFVEQLLNCVRALKVGDPLDDTTDVGPLIDQSAAERVETWVKEAVEDGAEVLLGGQREGNLWQPTVLTGLKEEMRVVCQEVFAPVVGIFKYSDVQEAILAVDKSDFGLQAGLFTDNLKVIQAAFDGIEVGGLMINDVATFRIDPMPYGGVKDSGFGREGMKYAIEEMTEMKLLTFNQRPG
jgi:acyl-CoA reductase-like NAD-dependent aldehyde dehydrogenase